jgi:N-acetylmuramoyl-L-alanine amidase
MITNTKLIVRFLILCIILLTSQKGICQDTALLKDIKINDIKINDFKNDGIKNDTTPAQSSVMLYTSKRVDYKWAKLKDKIYVDLKNTELSNINYKPILIDDGIIKSIRYSQYDLKTVRIVFELDRYKRCKVVRTGEANNIEVIFSITSEIKPKAKQIITKKIPEKKSSAKQISAKNIQDAPVTQRRSDNIESQQNTQQQPDTKLVQNIERKIKQKYKRRKVVEKTDVIKSSRKIIVIDPGHGGVDPGAISSNGLVEKDLTLDISMRIERILKEKYKETVYLTRNNDVYLPLDQRTAIANNKNADVFVSVHVNASSRTSLKGLETFLLSWSDDKEALSVASRENQISISKMKQEGSDLGIILSSLAREGKRDESLKLTHLIHSAMLAKVRGNYSSVEDLGVRKALFYVLVGASMPSALVEVGYLTNPQEEKRLRSKSYREDIAESIARGIHKYVITLVEEPKYARVVSSD